MEIASPRVRHPIRPTATEILNERTNAADSLRKLLKPLLQTHAKVDKTIRKFLSAFVTLQSAATYLISSAIYEFWPGKP